MRLSKLVADAGLAAGTADRGSGADPEITGLSYDSRDVPAGSVFFALPGHNEHGAAFAGQAARSGAAVIVTDERGVRLLDASEYYEQGDHGGSTPPVLVVDSPRASMAAMAAAFYGFPAAAMTMVGVTGTNGKTSVTYLVQAALQAAGRPCGIVGTLGTYYPGSPGGATHPHPRTTPEAPDLQRTLAELQRDGAQAVAMEVSSIAVCENRIDGIDFDVMGFTGLSHDHLDYHGTMDAYFDAKARMFAPGRCRAGVVVVDEPWGQRLAEQAAVPLTTVSTQPDIDATWRARRTESGVRIEGPESVTLAIGIPAGFAIANATLAIAIAHSLDVPAQLAADALRTASVPGRMESVASVDSREFLVDYAHTPDAIDRVVQAAIEMRASRSEAAGGHGRVVVVLGAGGDRDSAKRSAMGRAASQAGTDLVIVTDDNPRTEDPAQIRAAVRRGAESGPAEVWEIAPREEAIARAVQEAGPGDIVLVLGKGHEATQEVQGRVVAFDDRAVLASFIRQRFGVAGGGRGDGA